MFFLEISTEIDWKEVMPGGEDWHFLIETSLRTAIMFLVLLTGLRLLGKRGVKQLSVFELVVIIGLGSAAGDPMLYKDVGILPALVVFSIVIVLYKAVTYVIGQNKKFEVLVEGKPICLIKEGVFSIDNFRKEALGEDEFFSELRLQSVSHLGQIEEAIVETSGQISLFFYEDTQVKYGLPVMLSVLDTSTERISEPGHYSCTFCGYTAKLAAASKKVCPTCKKQNG
ncbi:DUF421 domain-containing protein [Runella slithyformis]|uniref:YetF C-terminal domain-containing protein n=1 Tax=Runella slithyformis (strain ATCC 29530 / DSM 19594 / LMG 11500 / NCIMB 11436 / LSU 4) TaxID=761193 RepID=A0A7U4E7F9_RUNSL|nr:YetF domain-containing protein [Runella slithyformis]AEI50129.1 protein of unknown function DUF421 [Runella slithyformis DSM 19594]